ncbi:hypothetical protein PAF17_14695 [Paracoccus sp. Z330]|uniref:Flagellar assembly protein FliH/Type III secretion system HrpE domain-containing protein n=1 Tax=Paracoccus onchidii TaxID=3017813 RepID=A0ABT4ZHF0_9RHOB|nr:hypothetical protein [Paracoccus onchidii]MDB6178743.1 hypothetical protein [Paracoccus onchidii]
MTPASFQLESFASIRAGQKPVPSYLQADLDQAYIDGKAEGVATAVDEQLRNLDAGLTRLAEALKADDAYRRRIRCEAVTTLAPILDAIIDNLAPPASSRRMEEALKHELERLSDSASPLRAAICCGPRQMDLVRRCIQEHALDGIELAECEGDRINLALEGGRIEISGEQIAEEIRALVSELGKGE